MKQIVLIFTLVFFYIAAFSQDCPKITGADIITLGPGSYQLHVTYTADGQKHIVDSLFCGNSFISTGCIDVHGSGTYDQTFSCTGGVPSAVLIPGTGTCINGTTCGNRILICPSCGPMPVTLSNFSAIRNNNDVVLSWQTQTEINSSHFDILRSYDNSNFVVIGTVNNISANSSTVHNYSFVDNTNASSNVTFYKLKIVDIDGRFIYSDIKVVRKSNSGKPEFVVYPNPAAINSNVTILGINGLTRIQFLDNSGRIIKTTSLTSSGTVELSGLKMGTYFMVLTDDKSGQSTVKKLSVVN